MRPTMSSDWESLGNVLFWNVTPYPGDGKIVTREYYGVPTPKQRREMEAMLEENSIIASIQEDPKCNKTKISWENTERLREFWAAQSDLIKDPSSGNDYLRFPATYASIEQAKKAICSIDWQAYTGKKLKNLDIPMYQGILREGNFFTILGIDDLLQSRGGTQIFHNNDNYSLIDKPDDSSGVDVDEHGPRWGKVALYVPQRVLDETLEHLLRPARANTPSAGPA